MPATNQNTNCFFFLHQVSFFFCTYSPFHWINMCGIAVKKLVIEKETIWAVRTYWPPPFKFRVAKKHYYSYCNYIQQSFYKYLTPLEHIINNNYIYMVYICNFCLFCCWCVHIIHLSCLLIFFSIFLFFLACLHFRLCGQHI